MIRYKIIRALLQGYKAFIMSYIWANKQQNEANWSPKPLNVALFLRILTNNELRAKRVVKFWSGGDSIFSCDEQLKK